MIRTGFVASIAAIALAACGGHGYVPSQSAAPGLVSMSSNPCYTSAVQPAWIFMGSCQIGKLTAKGGKFALAAYKGVTVNVTLPRPSKTGAFVLVDALGGKTKDIKPFKSHAFPALTPKTLKSVVYVQAVNSVSGLKFPKGNLVFTIKAAKFPGTSCPLSLITGTFPKLKWFNSPFSGKISSGTMTFTIPGGALGTLFPSGLPAGPLYFNVACK